MLFPAVAFSQTRTSVESTRPAPSPDGSQVAVVDHIARIVDGEAERYSGKMAIRITDTQGTVTRQRRVDATQARIVNTPQWLDDQWCAYTYNISKNANGVVYLDTRSGKALQVEFVAVSRRMGATDTVETELTSLEATDYGESITKVSNITRTGRSVFPLLLRQLPPFDGNPFPIVFAEQVQMALDAYRAFLANRGIRTLRIEQASESFNAKETHLAALACTDGLPAVLIIPLQAENPAAAMAATKISLLDDDVQLSCQVEYPAETDTDAESLSPPQVKPVELGQFGEFRFRTAWKDDTSVVVEKEIFETEEEESRKEPFFSVSLEGKLEKLARPEPTPPAAATPAPETATEPTSGATPKASPAPKPKQTPAKKPAGTSVPAAKSTVTPPRAHATSAPAQATPSAAAKERFGVLKKIVPGMKPQESGSAN